MVLRILLIGILIGFIFTGTVFGQATDSLKESIEILKEKGEPIPLLVAYREYCNKLKQEQKFDECLVIAQEGLNLARQNNQKSDEFFFLNALGRLHYFPFDEYKVALDYLFQAKDIEWPKKHDKDKAENLSNIADVYVGFGDYSEALSYQLEADRISENSGDSLIMARAALTLANIYWHIEKDQDALDNFSKALDLFRNMDRKNDIYTCIASIGAVYSRMGKSEAAMNYTKQAMVLADSIDYTYGVAYSKGILGNLYAIESNYELALENYSDAIDLMNELGIQLEAISFSILQSDIFVQQGRMDEAIDLLEKNLWQAREIKAVTVEGNLLGTLADVYALKGDKVRAYDYLVAHVALKDSLMNEDGFKEMVELEADFEVKQKEKEIANLQQASADSERQLYVYGAILGFVFLLALLGVVYNRNNSLSKINAVMAKKNEEIRMQNERLASSNNDLRQFAHATSHDLREPLRSIGSFSSLLDRRYKNELDEDGQEFLGYITRGVERMNALLGDLMAYSVVGIFQDNYEKIDINDVIALIIQSMKQEKTFQGARVSIQNLPQLVANRKQMIQLFHHLIDNAMKFRSEEIPEIIISCEQEGKMNKFSVRDNGIGMDETYKDKIFDLFLRLHTQRSKYKGTGIGLSICKKIVEQHKGKIWIESKEGVGTTVFFTLPESPINEMQPARVPQS